MRLVNLSTYKILTVVLTLGMMIVTAQTAAAWPESWPGAAVRQAPAKSVAVVKERVFDFGQVAPEETVSHDFIVENKGDGDLTIQQVSPG